MKDKRFHMVMTSELHQALKDVAQSEDKSMSEIVHEMLEETLLPPEPLREGENIKIFALSAEQLKRLNIPIVGTVVDDEELGNRVIPFPQGGGSEAA